MPQIDNCADKKILDLTNYWKEKCKEYENMEITPSNAERYRAQYRVQSRPLTWELPNNSKKWDYQRRIDQIQNDVDIAITKGQTLFRENEAKRFSEKYGNIIGPAVSAVTAFFYAVAAIFHRSE